MRFFYFVLDFAILVAKVGASLSAIILCDANGSILGIPALGGAIVWSVFVGLVLFWPEIKREADRTQQVRYGRTRYQYAREIDGGRHFDFKVDYSNPLDPLVHGTPADTLR